MANQSFVVEGAPDPSPGMEGLVTVDGYSNSSTLIIGGPMIDLAEGVIYKTLHRRRFREKGWVPVPQQLTIQRRGAWVILTGFMPRGEQILAGAARCSEKDTFSLARGIQIAARQAALRYLSTLGTGMKDTLGVRKGTLRIAAEILEAQGARRSEIETPRRRRRG